MSKSRKIFNSKSIKPMNNGIVPEGKLFNEYINKLENLMATVKQEKRTKSLKIYSKNRTSCCFFDYHYSNDCYNNTTT